MTTLRDARLGPTGWCVVLEAADPHAVVHSVVIACDAFPSETLPDDYDADLLLLRATSLVTLGTVVWRLDASVPPEPPGGTPARLDARGVVSGLVTQYAVEEGQEQGATQGIGVWIRWGPAATEAMVRHPEEYVAELLAAVRAGSAERASFLTG